MQYENILDLVCLLYEISNLKSVICIKQDLFVAITLGALGPNVLLQTNVLCSEDFTYIAV